MPMTRISPPRLGREGFSFASRIAYHATKPLIRIVFNSITAFQSDTFPVLSRVAISCRRIRQRPAQ